MADAINPGCGGAVVTAEREPFFSILSGMFVLLFITNNFYWKDVYAGPITGKLSDFAACFFLPLYVAALLKLAVVRPVIWRLRWGAFVSALVFAAVKTVPLVSAALNGLIDWATRWMGVSLRANRVDPTDLVALVMVPLAIVYAQRWAERRAI